MTDSVTEISNQSWFGRMGNAIKGILFGVILFGASFVVLFWNEGRTVNRTRDINYMKENTVLASADEVNPANDGKLIHMTHEATTDETQRDSAFGIEQQGVIKLRRNVEMYQWEEDKETRTKDKIGGGQKKVTTYEYRKDWSSNLNESSNFHEPQGHQNPSRMPVNNLTEVADEVHFGAYTLPDVMLAKWNNFTPLPLSPEALQDIPQNTRADLNGYWKTLGRDGDAQLQVSGGGIYVSQSPVNPSVGDLRINFSFVKPGVVSIIGRQNGSTFEPGRRPGGGAILEFREGTHSLNAMVEAAKKQNKMLAWILRFVGFLMMTIGLSLILAPLRVMAAVIPFMGRLVGGILGLFAALVSAALSLLTIAVAWVVYRPVLGIALIVVALIFLAAGFMLVKKRQEAGAVPTV